jgi:hypothetical protein
MKVSALTGRVRVEMPGPRSSWKLLVAVATLPA